MIEILVYIMAGFNLFVLIGFRYHQCKLERLESNSIQLENNISSRKIYDVKKDYLLLDRYGRYVRIKEGFGIYSKYIKKEQVIDKEEFDLLKKGLKVKKEERV